MAEIDTILHSFVTKFSLDLRARPATHTKVSSVRDDLQSRDLIRVHITALKLLEFILDTVRNRILSDLTLQWFNQNVISVGTSVGTPLHGWLVEHFRNPLRRQLITAAMYKNYSSVESIHDDIYQGIIDYFFAIPGFITPWDVLGRFSDPDGTSVITALTFPYREIQVDFIIRDENIRNVYDLSIHEFMGIVAATPFTENFRTLIYGTITPLSSFQPKLDEYLDQQQGVYLLRTNLLSDRGTLVYKFDNKDFLAGFLTPFSWTQDNHRNYWTEFQQWDGARYQTVTF